MHNIHESLASLAVSIASLNHDPANARKHNARNLEAIRASLAKFGQRKPIVVQRQGMIVRAGNGTLDAARALGWEQIAAVVVDEGDVEATAYAIADNRTAELAEWDEPVLGTLLATLRLEVDLDATITGFNEHEIAKLTKLAAAAPPDVFDEAPDPPKTPVSKPGEVWLLGGHRLTCGDSTDPKVAARVLRDDKPTLLLTDPPYTKISGDTRADWSQSFELVPSLRVAYVWHASAHAHEVALGLLRIGFEIKQQIIWRKPHFTLSRQHYHWQHEPCLYARKPGKAAWYGTKDQPTIWDAASPKALMQGSKEEKFDHPTQKPIALFTRPLENHTKKGALVYEPFGGSGTTLAAAEATGRRCLCVELDPKFVDVIIDRWQRISGGKAVRE